MIVVLDTNIIQQDYFMKSSRFAVFLDFVHRTQSQVALPKLVIDELQANFNRDLEHRLKTYHRDRNHLAACLLDPLPEEPEIHPADQTRRFIEEVLVSLQITEERLFPLRPQYLEDVVYRAVNRIPPCSDQGEEIRDALIWCSLKDIARELGEGNALFLSGNSKQFADTSGGLHQLLAEETEREGLQIQYVQSLEDFAREHASPIDFITEEWLAAEVDFGAVIESIRSKLEDTLSLKLPSGIIDGKSYTGNTRLIGGDLKVGDYFVNVLTDSSYRIEAVLQGDLQFDLEVFYVRQDTPGMSTGTSGSGLSFPISFPIRFSGSSSGGRPDHAWERVRPQVQVTLDISAKDKSVERWSVIDFTVDSPWRFTVIAG